MHQLTGITFSQKSILTVSHRQQSYHNKFLWASIFIVRQVDFSSYSQVFLSMHKASPWTKYFFFHKTLNIVEIIPQSNRTRSVG